MAVAKAEKKERKKAAAGKQECGTQGHTTCFCRNIENQTIRKTIPENSEEFQRARSSQNSKEEIADVIRIRKKL